MNDIAIAGEDASTLVLHLEPIAAHLNDESVTEIVINRAGEVLLERSDGWEAVRNPAISHQWCDGLAMLLRNRANQDLAEDWPLLGAQLPGGMRVQIVIPPAIEAGKVSFTTRRPIGEPLSMSEIIQGGAFEDTRCEQSLLMTPDERARIEALLPDRDRSMLDLFRKRQWEAFFCEAVEGRKNIVSSGATGSGKTTLGNALAAMIPMHERIITVEDVAEMRLPHANQVNLFYPKGANGVSKLRPRDLLEATLRMRPDRVLLAELRGDETFFFIQNVLNSGHPGTITTVHATRAKLAFRRLALMIKGSAEGARLDLDDIFANLYALVDVVVQMERLPGGRRVASEVYFDPAFAVRQLG
ncbi:P-type DNA transfer ATPase VirB11 [Massilia sp. TW-1]|uniref:Type IV secretion system protein n=1 Tax=Telluria antibiotica TaxID=2717319 RepID=A0ABX0P5M3_9BURK|nr:P-type DNA transfer ATPase VirB11 [Telluria antibiotica]NIA52537.1 P-type DNA transfer ATPase VirB11 [Telluria antibiotica]